MGAGKHQAGVDTGIKDDTSYFGHAMREKCRLKNDVMYGGLSMKRKRERSSIIMMWKILQGEKKPRIIWAMTL